MAVYMQIDPSPEQTQRTDLNELQPVTTSARTIAYPPLKSKDLIIEETNDRWHVEKVSFTKKHRAVIRQELVLRQYPKDDIKYNVPVNSDLRTLHISEKSKK